MPNKPVPVRAVVLSTILLIDDHAETCEALKRLFRRAGHEATVEVGLPALDVLGQIRPAVVLIDYMMPDVDGLDLIRMLRADPDPAVAATPVVMYSAVTYPAMRERATEAGADDYIAKGTPFPQMLKSLERFLQPS